MADVLFVKIPGVDGEATEKKHDKWIVVQSIGFDMSRNVDMTDLGSSRRGVGKAAFGAVNLSSQVCKASPKLMLGCASGKIYDEVLIDQCASGGDGGGGVEPYLQWKLSDVLVSSYSVSASENGLPQEVWALSYSKIQCEMKVVNQKTGALEKGDEFKWDLKQNVLA